MSWGEKRKLHDWPNFAILDVMRQDLKERLHYGGLGLVAVLVVIAGYLGLWPAIPLPLSMRGGLVGIAETPSASVPLIEWTAEWSLEQHPSGYPLLPGAEHFEVHPAAVEHGAYHHHPQIAHFRDQFVAIWSNHPLGEDGPGQRVVGAWSDDGRQWNFMDTVFEAGDEVRPSKQNGRMVFASSFVQVDDRLFAVAIIHDGIGFGYPSTPVRGPPESLVHTPEFPKRMRRPQGYLVREYRAADRWGPVFWLGREKPEPLPNFPAFPEPREADQLVADKIKEVLRDPVTHSTWDWEFMEAEIVAADGNRITEPTTLVWDGDRLLRLWRDMGGSRRMYANWSGDRGSTWSAAQMTEIPDAPAKSVLGRLSSGEVFLVGNQVGAKPGTPRDPLTIAIADDELQFERAYALRWRTPHFRVPPQEDLPDGRGTGFQYPSFVVVGPNLWVIYSVNKESIEVTRVPLASLVAPESLVKSSEGS